MTPGYEALHGGAAWIDVSARGRILVRGRDRARLLHNITSNDVKKMAPGASAYAFLLNPQGRIQADLSLLCLPDHFLIDTEPELREKVLAHIKRYIIADQVELEDVTAATAAMGVEGPAAEQLAPPAGLLTAPFTVTGQPGYRIYCEPSAKAEVIRHLETAGASPATAEDARVVRVENGKPRYGEDIRDTSLIQETRQLQGVSFNKGCYIGQEIVERVRAQGHINKQLVQVEIEGREPLPPGAKLSLQAGDAGEITSSVYSPAADKTLALAIVRTAFSAAGSVMESGTRKVLVLK